MSGPMQSAEVIGKTAHHDRAKRPTRVHLLWARREHDVDPEPVANLQISVHRLRVSLKVFWPIELERIDEDADDDTLTLTPCLLDQACMARMPRPHRWHKGKSC